MEYIENFDLMMKVNELYPTILERRVSLNLTGVSARTYLNWRKEGIVGDHSETDPEQRPWVRLNIYDYVWITIVKTLRDFGVSLSIIKNLKETFDTSWLQVILENGEDFYTFLRENTVIKEEEIEHYRKMVEYVTKDLEMEKISVKDKHLFSLFGSFVHAIIFKDNCRAFLVVYKEKEEFEFNLFTDSDLKNFNNLNVSWKNLPHLMIPLNRYVDEFLENPKNETNLEYWGFINKQEKKVLNAIHDNDFKEIIIKRQNGSEDLIIESTNDVDILGPKVKELRRILGLDQYSEVTIKYRNDKHLYFRKTQRI